MQTNSECPSLTLAPGEKLYGFKVLRVEQIPDIMISAYEIEHEKTGAKLLHLHSMDRENLFSIGFRTPPRDSRGVPHILEHSALAGSERYPLKDVFNELARGTLQTFINAFTYPDKTIYPVASQERTDFFNLARVYADLVLHPRLMRETFLQEGHHYEFADNGELTISGIVYNEMKGAYSSPETLMYNALLENLFPDAPYAHDSGGNPEVIPELSYEQFCDFHRTFYSPTNARFFLYGDIPTTDHLSFLADILAGFERIEVDSSIVIQPRWSEPRRIRNFFPIDKGESEKSRTTVNMAWMTAENSSGETAILLAIIASLLVGSAASPLRKALIDSGLGEDISPVTGLERDLQQIVFAVGLRGTDPDKESVIEQLVLDTLRKTVEKGFDRELVEGTLHQVEFHGREITRKSYPQGIVLMGRAYHTWLYDGDPLKEMNFPRIISSIRNQWEKEPALFQNAVREWLLENPHRLLSVMEPSATYQEERDQKAKSRLAEIEKSLTDAQREQIRNQSEMLRKFQTEPDLPEAAAALPKLGIADISRHVETIPVERLEMGGVLLLRHDMFTNGVAYLDLAFDISDIPDDLQPLLPLLGKLTTEMGAAGLSYEDMAKRIALYTGGLGFSLVAGETADGAGSWQKMVLSVKSLYRNTTEAVAIVRDILTKGDYSEEGRMRELVFEKKNGLHSAVIPSGHAFAQMAAAMSLSLSARRSEQWHGTSQLRAITKTSATLGETRVDLVEKLGRLRDSVFTKNRLVLNMTADEEGLKRLNGAVEALLAALPGGMNVGAADVGAIEPANIGVAIPADVCYVASAFPAPPYADPLAAPLFVLSRQLSNGILYRRIRVQGGAYGGFCRYEPSNGIFAFLSYRDPHLTETLDIYREAMDDVSNNPISVDDVEKAIIGSIGALDRPLDPAGKGFTSMVREFSGMTDELRTRFRQDILDVNAARLQDAARDYFLRANREAVVAVFAPEERLLAANETLAKKLKLEKLPG